MTRDDRNGMRMRSLTKGMSSFLYHSHLALCCRDEDVAAQDERGTSRHHALDKAGSNGPERP